ncbi:MAG: P-II family nitrogen regulator [Acidobacteria bacterium]|nr:P-II family nitrogen regulator [Acidobacteriota bacterium]
MKFVKCLIRPNRLEEVRDALSKLNVAGMTVSEVRGHGRQKGHKAIYRSREYSVTLLPKMMIEMVLPDDLVDEVLKVITETARTGEIGDGRIFGNCLPHVTASVGGQTLSLRYGWPGGDLGLRLDRWDMIRSG